MCCEKLRQLDCVIFIFQKREKQKQMMPLIVAEYITWVNSSVWEAHKECHAERKYKS